MERPNRSGDDSRDELITRVRDELTTVARRGSARARLSHASLSMVDQSLITYIGANSGCRTVEIASYFQLNKSTVSRQVNTLIERGYAASVERRGRGHGLRLTERGSAVRAETTAGNHDALAARLNDWDDADVAAFARMLERYNDKHE